MALQISRERQSAAATLEADIGHDDVRFQLDGCAQGIARVGCLNGAGAALLKQFRVKVPLVASCFDEQDPWRRGHPPRLVLLAAPDNAGKPLPAHQGVGPVLTQCLLRDFYPVQRHVGQPDGRADDDRAQVCVVLAQTIQRLIQVAYGHFHKSPQAASPRADQHHVRSVSQGSDEDQLFPCERGSRHGIDRRTNGWAGQSGVS